MAVVQKGPVNNICPFFCQEVILKLPLFIFFLELNIVEKYWVVCGHKWVCSLWLQDSKIEAVSHEEINGINDFCVCW